MAYKTLNTRIQLKYFEYKDLGIVADKVLLKGEVAAVEIPGTSKTIVVGKDAEGKNITKDVQTAPTVLFKVGDGTMDTEGAVTGTAFKDLPWLSALAADVYDWAKKSEDEFKTFVQTQCSLATTIQLDALKTHTDMGKDDEGNPVTVKAYVDEAISTLAGTLAGTRAEGDLTDQTVAGAKEYADNKLDEFLRAYITADERVQEKDEEGNPVVDKNGDPVYLPDAIDKLQEIAAWIADDETGAASVISRIDTLETSVYTKSEVDELIEDLPTQDTNTTYEFGTLKKDEEENSHVGKFTVKSSDDTKPTIIDTGAKEYITNLNDAMNVRVTAIETNYIRVGSDGKMYQGKADSSDDTEPTVLIISGGSAADVW